MLRIDLIVKRQEILFIIVGALLALGASVNLYREANWQLDTPPDMIIFANEKQYKAERGGHGIRNYLSGMVAFYDTAYVPPRETVNVVGGSQIELKVVDPWKPAEVNLYLYTYPKLNITELQLTKLSDYVYSVDIPEGDYQLGVLASWQKWSGSASAYYYFRIVVK